MTGLARDPAVPRRDALLTPVTMAGILSRRLLGGVPVDRCELVHVKYRFGESLRVVYRFGDECYVAARTFPAEASEARYHRALHELPGHAAGSPLPAVVHAPEVSAVLWVFPHDRRLTALPRLADPAGLGCARTRLVAYAAERSATAQCLDAAGGVLGYAKVHDQAAAEARLTRAVGGLLGQPPAATATEAPSHRSSAPAAISPAAHPHLCVPRVLAADDELLVLEALRGRRLDRAGALEALGAALGALHSLPRPAERFDRLDPLRLETAAVVVARARPDLAGPAARLLGRLTSGVRDADRAPVCLHGDANLRNALLLEDGRVGLIDLEHVSAGPAAVDLGQLLAGRLVARVQGGPAPSAALLLTGYVRSAPPPDRAALRWCTAASVLARIALTAVGRVRPDTLAHLRALLEAATDLVTPPPARPRRLFTTRDAEVAR